MKKLIWRNFWKKLWGKNYQIATLCNWTIFYVKSDTFSEVFKWLVLILGRKLLYQLSILIPACIPILKITWNQLTHFDEKFTLWLIMEKFRQTKTFLLAEEVIFALIWRKIRYLDINTMYTINFNLMWWVVLAFSFSILIAK